MTTAPTPESAPTAEPIQVGRLVHVYSDLWRGARPAVVVTAFAVLLQPVANPAPKEPAHESGIASRVGMANVNVMLDGLNDREVLYGARGSRTGNTIGSVDVFAPMNADQREATLAAAPECDALGMRCRFIAELLG